MAPLVSKRRVAQMIACTIVQLRSARGRCRCHSPGRSLAPLIERVGGQASTAMAEAGGACSKPLDFNDDPHRMR